MDIDVEDFKNKHQLTPEQLRTTKMTAEDIEIAQSILLAIEDMFMENLLFENGFDVNSYNTNHKEEIKDMVSEVELDNHEFNIDVNFERELSISSCVLSGAVGWSITM
mgnify:CR=1 FL=1